jgi:hypothetical protein
LKQKQKKLKIPQKQTHNIIRKRRREEELSFFLFSETFPRAPPPPIRVASLNRREREDFSSSARVVRKGEFRKRI